MYNCKDFFPVVDCLFPLLSYSFLCSAEVFNFMKSHLLLFLFLGCCVLFIHSFPVPKSWSVLFLFLLNFQIFRSDIKIFDPFRIYLYVGERIASCFIHLHVEILFSHHRLLSMLSLLWCVFLANSDGCVSVYVLATALWILENNPQLHWWRLKLKGMCIWLMNTTKLCILHIIFVWQIGCLFSPS